MFDLFKLLNNFFEFIFIMWDSWIHDSFIDLIVIFYLDSNTTVIQTMQFLWEVCRSICCSLVLSYSKLNLMLI